MTSEIITKQFKRGMTVEQIATLHSISTAHVEEVISSSGVKPANRKGPSERAKRPRKMTEKQKEKIKRKEQIAERLNKGMTIREIATELNLKLNIVQIDAREIGYKTERQKPAENTEVKERVKRRNEQIIECANRGLTIREMATELNLNLNTARSLVQKLGLKMKQPEIPKKEKIRGSNQTQEEIQLAAQETAVTTESDGFAENYTIAHMTKEEAEMTEAIAEVKQETEERDVRNDKWVHFVANQIEHAKVKTKFDVVQEGKKFIKRTEVRFVIEEVL